jgi:hypothetical protein
MLDEPAAHRRAATRERQRRAKARRHSAWRKRQSRGEMICPVPITHAMVTALVSWGWIQKDEIRDRRQIGSGIAAGIEQAIEDDPIVGYYLKKR